MCCARCTTSVCCQCVYVCVFASRVEIAYDRIFFGQLTTYVYISSTIKQDCKAGVKLSLSDDGQHLVANEVNEEHSHDISNLYASPNIIFISGIM